MKKYVYAIIGGFVTFMICEAVIIGISILTQLLLMNYMDFKQLTMLIGIIMIIFAFISAVLADKVYQTIKNKYK